MYTVVVEGTFSAIHSVPMPDGTLEPLHGHDWIVRVHVKSDELDEQGMVVDFHQAQSLLEPILMNLHHRNLNEHRAFSGRPPTAERVAKHVFDRLLDGPIEGVARVEVREAPGYVAVFEPAD